ncbi:MAG TPA: ferritin family protein [Spirochaetia bacterium]|nr:ferritin family protein [Spirochaetia bacterium]
MTFASPAEVFAYAIRSEEESFRFYTAMAEKAPSYNTRQVLHSLAADEEQHRGLLVMIMGNQDGEMPAGLGHLTAAEEAGNPGRVAEARDALAAAVERETAAYQLYSAMAAEYPPGHIRRSLEQMAAMEKGHQHKVEEILLNMQTGEVW